VERNSLESFAQEELNVQIELNVLIEHFAVEFVSKFRELGQGKDITIPSMRQSIAIAKLLSARYMKHGKLNGEDFVNTAVVTSYPIAQKTAEGVAKDTFSRLFSEMKANLRAGVIE
jgi:hypothetical protein